MEEFWTALGRLTFAETVLVAETMRDVCVSVTDFEHSDANDWLLLLNTARWHGGDRARARRGPRGRRSMNDYDTKVGFFLTALTGSLLLMSAFALVAGQLALLGSCYAEAVGFAGIAVGVLVFAIATIFILRAA